MVNIDAKHRNAEKKVPLVHVIVLGLPFLDIVLFVFVVLFLSRSSVYLSVKGKSMCYYVRRPSPHDTKNICYKDD